MPIPEKYHLDALRKLRGDAYVTHPDSTLGIRRVERVFSVARGGDETAYGTPAASEYTDTVLVEQHTVGGDHIYVEIYQAYENLPSAWVPFTRYDDNLGPIQGRRRAVVNTGQVATLGATGKATFESRNGSAYVLIELQENWSDGTGGAGNPAFPILDRDFYDDDRGPVQQRTQIVVRTGSEQGSLSETGGVVTRITYEPFNEFLLRKITETWSNTGADLSGKHLSDGANGGLATAARQLLDADAADVTPSFRTLSWADEKVNVAQKRRTLETLVANEFPILHGSQIDPQTKIRVAIAKQFVPNIAGTLVPNGCKGSIAVVAGVSSTYVETQPYDERKSIALTSVILDADLPADYEFEMTINVNLPDILDDIEYLSEDGDGSTTPSGFFAIPCNVTSSWQKNWSGEAIPQIRKGYHGKANARVERSFSIGPLTGLGAINLIQESVGGITIEGGNYNSSHSIHVGEGPVVGYIDSFGQGVQYRGLTIPPVITPGINISGAFGTGVAIFTVRLPASTPTTMNSGDEILYDIEVTELRNSVWRTDLIYVTVP